MKDLKFYLNLNKKSKNFNKFKKIVVRGHKNFSKSLWKHKLFWNNKI